MASATQQQQALILDSKFGNLAIHTVNVPKPGVGEVLIRVHSVALNPVDWKVHKYNVLVENYPTVLGLDIAGDVVQVGEGISGFEVGDRVFCQGSLTTTTGGFQQYAIAKYPFIAKIPPNLTYDDVSTLPIAAVTGYLAMFHKSPSGFGLPNVLVDGRNKTIGQAIVILGGPSQVGQFGKSYPLSVSSNKHNEQLYNGLNSAAFLTSSPQLHSNTTDYLKSLGATNVIDRNASQDAISSQFSNITGSSRIKYVIDSIGAPETQQLGYDLLSADGELVLVVREVIKNKVEGKKVHFPMALIAPVPTNHEVGAIFFKHITSLLAEGAIKVPQVDVLPRGLDGITDGLKRLENNQVSGVKLVARPQET